MKESHFRKYNLLRFITDGTYPSKNKINRRMFMKNTRNLNRILVACVAFLLVFVCSFITVSANDHTHEFTDGVCSCGDLKIEAESTSMVRQLLTKLRFPA